MLACIQYPNREGWENPNFSNFRQGGRISRRYAEKAKSPKIFLERHIFHGIRAVGEIADISPRTPWNRFSRLRWNPRPLESMSDSLEEALAEFASTRDFRDKEFSAISRRTRNFPPRRRGAWRLSRPQGRRIARLHRVPRPNVAAQARELRNRAARRRGARTRLATRGKAAGPRPRPFRRLPFRRKVGEGGSGRVRSSLRDKGWPPAGPRSTPRR